MKMMFVLTVIGIVFVGSLAYVWAQDIHWYSYDECFEMGKLPKVDKLNDDTYMISCINLNPFEN